MFGEIIYGLATTGIRILRPSCSVFLSEKRNVFGPKSTLELGLCPKPRSFLYKKKQQAFLLFRNIPAGGKRNWHGADYC